MGERDTGDLELLCLGRGAWPTPAAATALEWWLGNGLGGWASGTVSGALGRSYHGLLAAARRPPTDRVLLLSKVDVALVMAGADLYRLYCNHWASGATEAPGLAHLTAFRLAPYPTWTYAAGGWLVEQQVFPVHGWNATCLRWTLTPGPGAPKTACLLVRPWVTGRNVHDVACAGPWPVEQVMAGDGASLPEDISLDPATLGAGPWPLTGPACAPGVWVRVFPDTPPLYLLADGGTYFPGGGWILGVYYPLEEERQGHTREDLYVPGTFVFPAAGAAVFTLLAATPPLPPGAGDPAAASARPAPGTEVAPPAPLPPGWGDAAAEAARTRARRVLAPFQDRVARTLAWAGDQFVSRRASTGTRTLLAGFPWFADWGRDTLISLHGLALTAGRLDLAQEWIVTFGRHMAGGLVPNCFADTTEGEALYNSADATLWYAAAAWRYLQAGGDPTFVRQEVYPRLREAVARHLEGTHFGIAATPEGLLRCGSPDVQVTWMDAQVEGWVVTPRDGLPVEIQALWYNALCILARLADLAGDSPTPWERLADQAQAAFRRRFWDPARGCLYDRIDASGTPDPALRPNQLLAISLDFPLVEGDGARRVVDAVFRHLWTPYGLRSLAPGHPDYRGTYQGSRRERDAAYHQGTAWAWLVGPFVTAYLKAYGRTPTTLRQAEVWVRPLVLHLAEHGLGTVAEIFDGDAPHRPRGCPAQAWSVAELLRIWVEELGHR